MNFTAAQISALVDGKMEGDAKATVSSFGKIESAEKGQLAFLSNSKYEEYLYSSRASVIIISDTQEIKQPMGATLIRVQDAHAAFVTVLTHYKNNVTRQLQGRQEPVYVSATAKIGENVFIGAFSYIGDHAVIGDNVKIFSQVSVGNNVVINQDTVLYAGVKIYDDCIIGKNVIIHAGSVLGSDGFGFLPQKDNTLKKIPQIGNVIIEDDVEIGANSAIDRATMGSTVVKKGAKLDNLIQIAHNVEVGANTVMAAQSGISGSTKIGNHVMIGGQVGIVDHVEIADAVKIGAQSGVTKSIKIPGSMVVGSPAFEYISSLRGLATIPDLPELKRRVTQLENLVQQLMTENTAD